MSPAEVEFLRRLHAEQPATRKSDLARYFERVEGLGQAKGTQVAYQAGDWARAATILATRGFELERAEPGFARRNAPAGGSEKTGARPVSDGLVAVQALNMPLHMQIPRGSFAAMPWREAMALDYQVLLICENLEPLLHLQDFRWLEDFVRGRAALVVFRGTVQIFTTGAAAQLIAADSRPTLAFFDFDPKGLQMAAAVPRRESLCLPRWPLLEALVKSARRDHLFTNSAEECRSSLDTTSAPEIALLWSRLKTLGMGLNQEGMHGIG